ncbi:methyl-accepting chemotaxis protein [Priestia taiwanensis]|uniref:Methyl-accepting chemotaxis protein n=1 Tax=Priestia taiwanensis TaxID=1347902 RepID=A0A917ETX8_9BACI|nr:methyl-accepting chemotaxis protein [Priestia taiwanensis]MBM7364954.1 methyl-accepting chemotaxis protein [Priestia taiwanensis]GGE82258.1 hypothetical protein GCM10007140_34880 [Priestia taiwanensis]
MLKKKRKRSIGRKIFKGVSIFIIIFALVFSGVFYSISSYIVKSHVLANFERTIQSSMLIVKKEIDLSLVERAVEDERESDKQALAHWLSEKEAQYGVDRIYVLGKIDNEEFMLRTGESALELVKSSYSFTEEINTAFSGTPMLSDLRRDEFGVHKSGFTQIDEQFNEQFVLGIDMDATFIDDLNNLILYVCIALTGTMVVIGGICARYLFAKPLTKRINYLLEHTKKMADGDLTTAIEVAGEDELSQLASSFNNMNEQLRDMMKKVVTTSNLVATASHLLAERATGMKTKILEAAASAQEISSGSEAIVNVSEENAQAMEEITQGIQGIAESSTSVLEQAELASEEAKNGDITIQHAMKQMNLVLYTSTKSVGIMEVMNRRTQEIEEIASIITSIAGQINLLSLNAAIEAARAGENGKGFAVVANEVRKLADQSAVSASQITASLKGVQEDSYKSVEAMKQMKAEVDVGSVLVNEAGEAFSKLRSMIECVNAQTHAASVATQQIAAGAEEISASLEETTSITESALYSTQQITASTQEQLITMKENEKEVHDLEETARELKKSVSYFKV